MSKNRFSWSSPDKVEAVGRLASKVLVDEQYREQLPALHRFMSRSREVRDHPTDLFQLQVKMSAELWGAQQSQKALRETLRSLSLDTGAEAGEPRKLVAVSKRLAYILKGIGDGIAWRTLSYNRSLLHLLSTKPHTGHIEPDSTANEMAIADLKVNTTGDRVVLNDLTNFLRHGDVTEVGSDGSVSILEVKGGLGSAKSGKATRQRRRLRERIQFFQAGRGRTEVGDSAIFQYTTQLRTHLGSVSRLLRDSRKDGVAYARLSDCIAVEVWRAYDLIDKGIRPPTHNPFDQSTQSFTVTSLDMFDVFSRNVAPYSVFPFDDQDCSDLLTGAVWLVTHYNYGNLLRCLRRRGLQVTMASESERQVISIPLGRNDARGDEVLFRISRPGDPRNLAITGPELSRPLFEFLDDESFADTVEEVLNRTGFADVGLALYPAYLTESSLWD